MLRWPLLGLLFVSLAGCAAPVTAPAAAPLASEVTNRRAAIASAQRDAARQFGGDGWIESTEARLFGRFWVVELHARNGSLVRYSIATRDGAIHERAVLQ